MATSGSFNTSAYTDGYTRYLTFSWNLVSQNVANNTSTISWSLVGAGTGPTIYFMSGNFEVKIDGEVVYASSTRIQLFPGTVVATGTKTITHNSDGSKSFTASAKAGIYYVAVNVSGSGSWSLPTIPRQAEITAAPNFTDEQNPIINYTNKAGSSVTALDACISFDGVTDNIPYRAISKTGSSYTFNLTSSERTALRNYYNGAPPYTVYFIIRTKIGSTTLYSSVARTLTIVNANPTGTLNISSVNGSGQSWMTTPYVQGKSKVSGSFTGAAYKGANISKYTLVVDSVPTVLSTTNASATITSGFINKSGTVNVSGYVTDSRGNISTPVSTNITVIPYGLPYVGKNTTTGTVVLARCYFDGTPANDGTYLKLICSKVWYSLGNGENTAKLEIRLTSTGYNSGWISVSPTSETAPGGISTGYKSAYNINKVLSGITVDITKVYTATLRCTDRFGAYSDYENIKIPSGAVDFHLREGGQAVGFGMYPTASKTVQINPEWSLRFGDVAMADFVFEQGTSGIWMYRRWNSGFAELWCAYASPNVACTQQTAGASSYYSDPITVDPFPFSLVQGSIITFYSSKNGNRWYSSYNDSTATNVIRFRANSTVAVTTSFTTNIYVVGRWQ